MYLVYVEDLADFETITPFIVGIPTWDDEDELFQYDVTVYPKHTALPRILVNKVDSVTGQKISSQTNLNSLHIHRKTVLKVQNLKLSKVIRKTGTAEFLIRYGTTYIGKSQVLRKDISYQMRL